MGHVPHLWVPGPWETPRLDPTGAQLSHLTRVLRMGDDEPIGYTDGVGTVGEGRYRAGGIIRGEERAVSRPSDLVVICAPPENRDRLRFLVEKLSELGVARLRFLDTVHGQGRPPSQDRLHSWAVAGLEQSRGGWLLDVSQGLVTFSSISGPFVVCEPGGDPAPPHARTVVIGPEGGWAVGEVPDRAPRLGLGDTVLRVETAAIVAAARLM